MRLRLLTIAGAATLALAAPSAALAHHGHGRHGHKHHAKAHHAQFHFEHIGASGVSAPTSTPPPPASPTTTPEPNAGEIVEYTTETKVLKLMLGNKETVSGVVTPDTKLECVSETTAPTPSGEPTDTSPGDDSGSGDDQSSGDMSQSGDKSGQSSDQTDQEDSSDDDGAGPTAAPEPPCETLLKAGTKVRSAELRIGPSGDEFEELVLVR